MKVIAKIETPRGKVIKTSNGDAILEWNPNFQNKWQGRYSRAQMFVDSEVLRLSEPYVPFQSGMLAKSGILGTLVGSGEVVWNAPHSKYLYYGKVMVGRAPKTLTDKDLTYHGAPKRGAFWFERMKKDHGNKILKGAAKLAGGK
jgi:hypothetical protein